MRASTASLLSTVTAGQLPPSGLVALLIVLFDHHNKFIHRPASIKQSYTMALRLVISIVLGIAFVSGKRSLTYCDIACRTTNELRTCISKTGRMQAVLRDNNQLAPPV